MKKIAALLLTVVFAALLIAGCGSTPPAASPSPSQPSAGTTPPAAGGLKTGLAVVTSSARSADAGENDGIARTDSYIAAVTVGGDGKIVSCVLDSVVTIINFDGQGKLVTPLNTEYLTKNELGDAYEMKKNSDIGKEWYEQAAAFSAYVTGKTAAEVGGIAVDDTNHAADADLKASVTVSIGDFIRVVGQAMTNARELGAAAGDKLSVGAVTTIARSADAGENDGLAQAYSTYAAVTTGADGKITSCVIDASQANVNFDAAGKLTSDTAADVETKNTIGDAYGMKDQSDIGKEWYEQAASFAQYTVGKTVAEVKGIAVDGTGHASDADLKAMVTVSVGDFMSVVEKAAG